MKKIRTVKVDLVCMSCKAKARVAQTSSVGDLIDQSGFYAVMGFDGSMHWLCPACAKKACDLAQQIRALLFPENPETTNTDLYFDGLLLLEEKLKSREKARKETP